MSIMVSTKVKRGTKVINYANLNRKGFSMVGVIRNKRRRPKNNMLEKENNKSDNLELLKQVIEELNQGKQVKHKTVKTVKMHGKDTCRE